MEEFMGIEFIILNRIETNKFNGEDIKHNYSAYLPKIKVLKINHKCKIGNKGAEHKSNSTTLTDGVNKIFQIILYIF